MCWAGAITRSEATIAIRRHWQLVCCAFSFCWWAYGRLPTEEVAETSNDAPAVDSAGRGKKESQAMLATNAQGSKGVAGALQRHSQGLILWPIASVGKPARPIFCRDSRQRSPYGFN